MATDEEGKSAEDWKNAGNKYFSSKDFRSALKTYRSGLNLEPHNVALLSNLAAVYLNLDYFHRALETCETLLEVDPNNSKGIYRKAKSLTGLKMYEDAIKLLEQKKPSMDKNFQKDFDDLLGKLKLKENQRITGEFDVFKVYMSITKIHDDIADFNGPVEIANIEGKGRGLVATEDIKPGQWVIVSKAFGITFPDVDTTFGSYTSGLDDLDNLIIEKLTAEPELRKEFYQLYAGTDIPSPPPDGFDYSVIDEERIKGICKSVSFCGTVNSMLESIRQGDSYRDSNGVVRQKSFYGTSKGVWILPAYLNHSCWDANCFHATYGDVMLIRSFKDIKAGEEILIPYMKAVEFYWKRERDVFKPYNFICNCAVCLIDRSEPPEVHDKRDEILGEIMQSTSNLPRLEELFKELVKLRPSRPELNLCSIMPYQFLANCYYDRKEFLKSAEINTKMHDMMVSGPLIREGAPIAANIASNYIEAGDYEKGRMWGEVYKIEMMLAYGTLKVDEVISANTVNLLRLIGIRMD